MKRLILMIAALLCLMPMKAWAYDDPDTTGFVMSGDDLIAAAEADFPDWTFIDSSQYQTGRREEQSACWMAVSMMRIEANTLYQRTVSALVNPLKKGEPVPWEVTDWAPIPLSQAAADTLQSMNPGDLYRNEDGHINETGLLSYRIVQGCALFLLDEGETWSELYSYPTAIAGVVNNAEGQQCVRIAHWDGARYDEVASSRFFTDDWFSINGHQSDGTVITINGSSCNPQFVRQPDGRWLFAGIADGNWTLYRILDGFVTDANGLVLYDSNDVLHYGVPAFDCDLTTADIPAIPDFIRDVIPQLNSSDYACARADGTPMLNAPDGEVFAACYARLTGRIIRREGGFVQLQIGSDEHGLTGWFAEESLAYGHEIEGVRCGFPSHSEDDCKGDYLAETLNGVDPEKLPDTLCLVWLIGKLPNGEWLVQLDVDTVCTAPEKAFHDIGPATELWAEFEAYYDQCEEEMLYYDQCEEEMSYE